MPKLYATVEKEHADRLAIETHYILEPEENTAFRGFGTRWINRPESYLGISFDGWEKYVGQTVPFCELEGEGEGMIGGPTKTHVGGENEIWLYDGGLEGSRLYSARRRGKSTEIVAEVRKEMEEWSQLLQDDSYAFTPDMKQEIERLIKNGQEFLQEPD